MKMVILSWFILCAAVSSAPVLDGSGAIEVSVRDLSGRPVAGATVYAFKTDRMGSRLSHFTADSDGRVVLRNLLPGSYEVHAYKESEGYPDTFFSFFVTNNKKAWRVVDVTAGRTTSVILQLGPKYARLKLVIRNELGDLVDASLTLKRVDDPQRPYSKGVNGESDHIVPPVPFRLNVAANGYQAWQSKVLRPRSGETLEVTVRLTKSH